MNYLVGYPDEIRNQVGLLLAQGNLADLVLRKYSGVHEIRTDKALYFYVMDMKNRFLRNARFPSKVVFDHDIRAIKRALGTHTAISRIQGGKLRAKNEIRIAALFKQLPLEFLKMIIVHELAHLKEKEHNKAFYNLCVSMEPAYHQFEFDLRLYLTSVERKRDQDSGPCT